MAESGLSAILREPPNPSNKKAMKRFKDNNALNAQYKDMLMEKYGTTDIDEVNRIRAERDQTRASIIGLLGAREKADELTQKMQGWYGTTDPDSLRRAEDLRGGQFNDKLDSLQGAIENNEEILKGFGIEQLDDESLRALIKAIIKSYY